MVQMYEGISTIIVTVDGGIATPHLCFKTVHQSSQLIRFLRTKDVSRLGLHTLFYDFLLRFLTFDLYFYATFCRKQCRFKSP